MLQHHNGVVLQEDGGADFLNMWVPLVDPHPPALASQKVAGEQPTDAAADDFDRPLHCETIQLFGAQKLIAPAIIDNLWNV